MNFVVVGCNDLTTTTTTRKSIMFNNNKRRMKKKKKKNFHSFDIEFNAKKYDMMTSSTR